jgi:hypothetical protein
MEKTISLNKAAILNNVIAFCNNDTNSGKELFEIIQKSIGNTSTTLSSCFEEKEADEFKKSAHKIRFALSVLKVEEIHQLAIYIDDCINAENFNNSSQQEIMLRFINKIQALDHEINK